MAEHARDAVEILVLNEIAQAGLARLSAARYTIVKESARPEAILLRSRDLHGYAFGDRLRAVGRAGAGVNNIPVAELTQRGVPVFNAPGGNANAVKELVLAGMLIAARRLAPALDFVRSLDAAGTALDKRVEEGKKAFAGSELKGRTLGVIGLGKVGCLVADAAIHLGMEAIGFDPEITVDAAWSLPAQVRRAASIVEVLKASDYVSLHVPLVDKTRGLIGEKNLAFMRPGAVLLNFSRDGVVDERTLLDALRAQRLKNYVTDFPSAAFAGRAEVVALPHLGASTEEAEENCAVMVVDQLRDFLENGNVRNAVNFPDAAMEREVAYRLAIAHANVPDMLARISHTLGGRRINIHNMLNKSKGDTAYTLLDVESPVPEAALAELRGIEGMRAIRYLGA
ncbi:MAG: 3-phosphoglycerate dehydrogenase family protein [Betaproteobacteria bacterium]|nr:3-phosphoglycerate dehydrogenase family protein [Betaproteobacteria bacterium]